MVCVVLAVTLVVGGCGSDSGSGAAAPNGEVVTVDAVDNSFKPESVTIEAGTEVVWDNRGRNEHNIIPEDESAPWKVEADAFQPGQTARYTFTEPGTYAYYCSIHGNIDVGMPGVIIVK